MEDFGGMPSFPVSKIRAEAFFPFRKIRDVPFNINQYV
jgi:hypothetical protein